MHLLIWLLEHCFIDSSGSVVIWTAYLINLTTMHLFSDEKAKHMWARQLPHPSYPEHVLFHKSGLPWLAQQKSAMSSIAKVG